jgi:hypothetical protein
LERSVGLYFQLGALSRIGFDVIFLLFGMHTLLGCNSLPVKIEALMINR